MPYRGTNVEGQRVHVHGRVPTWRDIPAILWGTYSPEVIVHETQDPRYKEFNAHFGGIAENMIADIPERQKPVTVGDLVGISPLPREERIARYRAQPLSRPMSALEKYALDKIMNPTP